MALATALSTFPIQTGIKCIIGKFRRLFGGIQPKPTWHGMLEFPTEIPAWKVDKEKLSQARLLFRNKQPLLIRQLQLRELAWQNKNQEGVLTCPFPGAGPD